MTVADRYSRLTPVGAHTSMGRYMRFFWHPVAATAELADVPKRVEILGEKLVLFRTTSSQLGLVQERCAHRSASLACGMIENDGIRCAYHGWKYDLNGQCQDVPAEGPSSKLKDRVKIAGYPVQELGGLIWAYLGEQPAPLLPRWEFLVGEQYDHDVGLTVVPCNWLQIAENNVDPYHVEYLHFMFTNYVHERKGKPKIPVRKHRKVAFDIFEHGIIKRRLWEGESEEFEEWRVGHPQIWPGTLLVTYPNNWVQAQIRVPINDTSTMIYWYNAKTRPKSQAPAKDVLVWDYPYQNSDGTFDLDVLNTQDMMMMVTQGEIADRSLETLSESDRGIVLYRRVLLEQLERIERGEEPMGVIRDPAKNFPFIELPMEKHVDYTMPGVHAQLNHKWDEHTKGEAAE